MSSLKENVKAFLESTENLINSIPSAKDHIYKHRPTRNKIVNTWVDQTYLQFKDKLDLTLDEDDNFNQRSIILTIGHQTSDSIEKHPLKVIKWPWILFYHHGSSLRELNLIKKSIFGQWDNSWDWLKIQTIFYSVITQYQSAVRGLTPLNAELIRYLLHLYNQISESYPIFKNAIEDAHFYDNYQKIFYPGLTHSEIKQFYSQQLTDKFVFSQTTFRPQIWNLNLIIQPLEDRISSIPDNYSIGGFHHNSKLKFDISWISESLNRRHHLYKYQVANIHKWWNFNHLQLIKKIYNWNILDINEYFPQWYNSEVKTRIIPDWSSVRPVDDPGYQDSSNNWLELSDVINAKTIKRFNRTLIDGNPMIDYENLKKYPLSNPLHILFCLDINIIHIPSSKSHVLFFLTKNTYQRQQMPKWIEFFKSWLFHGVLFELKGGICLKFWTPLDYDSENLNQLCQFIREFNPIILTPSEDSLNAIHTHILPPAKYFDEESVRWDFSK